MRLGKVIGRVTLSQMIPAFEGGRWLVVNPYTCLLYTSPSPRDRTRSRMPSSA